MADLIQTLSRQACGARTKKVKSAPTAPPLSGPQVETPLTQPESTVHAEKNLVELESAK